MPERGRKLVLHSPAGSEHATYGWPLSRSVSIRVVWVANSRSSKVTKGE